MLKTQFKIKPVWHKYNQSRQKQNTWLSFLLRVMPTHFQPPGMCLWHCRFYSVWNVWLSVKFSIFIIVIYRWSEGQCWWSTSLSGCSFLSAVFGKPLITFILRHRLKKRQLEINNERTQSWLHLDKLLISVNSVKELV